MTPKFELGEDFCTVHLPPKFHHPMFTRSEVIMLTNKQTNTQTNRCLWKHQTLFAMLRLWVMIFVVIDRQQHCHVDKADAFVLCLFYWCIFRVYGDLQIFFVLYAVGTCEIELFQNYSSLRRRPTEIKLFHCVETCLWNCFRIISEAHCSSWIFSEMFSVAEIILK